MHRVLRFRANWQSYHESKGEDALCPSGLCGEELDTLVHAKKCRFLTTKWHKNLDQNPREIAKFLRMLNTERVSKWRTALW